MTTNRYAPHLLVLPEDDANRQIVNGFCSIFDTRQIQILTEARGWSSVCRRFEDDYVPYMRKYVTAFIVLVVDFDNQSSRMESVKACVPPDISNRVFVLGTWTEPEDLRTNGLGHFEKIGEAMAHDCPPVVQGIWSHKLLVHNASEIARFRSSGCLMVLR